MIRDRDLADASLGGLGRVQLQGHGRIGRELGVEVGVERDVERLGGRTPAALGGALLH